MSIEEMHESGPNEVTNQLGYRLFREGSVRRFNPGLFAVRREDRKGWFLVELKDGKWVCDCATNESEGSGTNCPHVYAALLSSATRSVEIEESDEPTEERQIKCRYCGSPDISKVGFRYNARGISRRYLCNECCRKFSVPYVEPQAVVGGPSGTLWLLSQVAMLTSKLNDLLRDLDDRIASATNQNLSKDSAGSNSETSTL
jgi:DNA-directed RNA polymerase subunit RPC12/RpoP